MVAPSIVSSTVGEGHDGDPFTVVGGEGLGVDEAGHRAGEGRHLVGDGPVRGT